MTMLVLDTEKTERAPLRRKTGDGRLLHCCCVCGKLDVWGPGWATYCSDLEIDESHPIPKFCSDRCQERGGADASLVTAEMKRTAQQAEWRDPEPVYREATEREKYNAAVSAQRR